ncbi:MAG TPA: SGNH/GDSL hydrolase family protein [Steroidobacteraceae bacterium]|nr:SGNH/GDSL hydrolase family protein [Steroidobacteraceae bacterium]
MTVYSGAGMRVALCVAVSLGLGLTAPGIAVASSSPAAAGGGWVAAWYSPPFPTTAVWDCNQVRTFSHRTVRQVVRLEAAGDRVRIRLTNELGLEPLQFGAVHVALSSPNGVTEPGTDRAVTFAGKPGAIIPTGKALVSDPVDLRVRRFQELAISVYYPSEAAPAGHLAELDISSSGDHAAESVWPDADRAQSPGLASTVAVEQAAPQQVLVAFGDSITEGDCATDGTHRDYPEQLAVLLAAQGGSDKSWIVINSGISGNRLLHDGSGPKALARFDRDALDIEGVRAILLLEGINDIGWAFDSRGNGGPLAATDIIGAYQDLIRRAHARGLQIFLGTLVPYEGAKYSHPAGERVREEVNAWIRKGQGFDGVVDFDAALRDPASPLHFLGADQCGDDLHPNDAGYHAMAETAFQRLVAPGAAHAPRARRRR